MAKASERPTDKSLFWRIVEDVDVRIDHVQRALLRYLADVGGSATDFELRTRIHHPPSRIKMALDGLSAEGLVDTANSDGYLVASLTRDGRRIT
ncbi:hypothetical protein G6O69_25420 [Pseudenhygromyxa sp. WMMC2535]|uniref:hypothetical protein n=1 Tax=Pseudenhygromyxa sp. WMMC2535 TaxID=2712867 RepID=UPI0015953ECB|nr:hypothetical protein [Pseudenhygromyxa sp. WMMC2535]NVB41204.1 hypothetical protein [Pseudenhygromyxa sp. WMMC2535]